MPAKSPVDRGRQRGQTLVEFALILPVFVTLTLGVLDAARVFSAQVALSNSVREAAVFASRTTNYLAWCRNPADAADAYVPQVVACPSGTTAANHAPDPNNIAYRIAAETDGLDRSKITLAAPRCGLSSALPTVPCSALSVPRYVRIEVSYEMSLLTPLVAQLWGTPMTITAEAVARTAQ
jgi:hypothetical protein